MLKLKIILVIDLLQSIQAKFGLFFSSKSSNTLFGKALRKKNGSVNTLSFSLKGLTQLWKSRPIYPKYMPKCLVGSTDYACNFFTKKYLVMWKILMFEISAKKGLCDVIFGSEEKSSDLAAHFSRNSGAANTVLFTIETFNKHPRMTKLSQPYLRGHMRWNVASQ